MHFAESLLIRLYIVDTSLLFGVLVIQIILTKSFKVCQLAVGSVFFLGQSGLCCQNAVPLFQWQPEQFFCYPMLRLIRTFSRDRESSFFGFSQLFPHQPYR